MGTSNPGKLLLSGLKRSEKEPCEHWGCVRGSATGGVALGRRRLPGSECRFWGLNPAWTSYMPGLPHLYMWLIILQIGLRFKFDTD